MTNLSPKAQAIIDAADEVFSHGGRIRDGFASALRVLADYKCFYGDKEYDAGMEGRNDEIREAILSIATELEAL
jgi:hypothetical protein